MKGICNEEKNLKRYLKNHVSLNIETMVKFLITGIIGVSLTACGGGGGGGGSSDSKPPVVGPEDPKPEPPVTPPVVEETEVNKNNETHEVTNSNSIITGTIAGTQDGFTALKAVNSTVENKATISVTGDGSIGIHGTTDTALFSTRANHIVTNSGTISVSGHKAVGMLVENGVTGINNGNIKAISNIIEGKYIEEDEYDPNVKYIYQNRYGFVVGAVSKNGSNFINNKEIKIDNFGVGIIAVDNSTAINNGEIIGKSGKLNVTVETYDEEGKLIYSTETSTLEGVGGMFAVNKSTVTNGENGKIWISGEGSGLVATGNSTAINNGEIYVDLSREGSGIYAENKSKALNNKLIYIESLSSSSNKWISGIDTQHGSSVENNGTIQIKINSSSDYFAGAYGIIMSNEYSEDIKREKVIGINNGLISVEADGSGYVYASGVDIDDDDYLEKFENSSTGKIEIMSTGEATGICVSNKYEESYILNNGIINVAGIKRANGIIGHGVGLVENVGTVRVEGEGATIGISATGYPQFDSPEYSIGNVNVKNSGDVLVLKEGTSEISNDNIGVYLHGKEMVLNNTSTGKIVVTGDDAIGVKANSYDYPVNEGKSIIINDGLISVNGKSGDDYDNSHIPTGIQAFTYNENNKGLIINNRKIEVESSDDARGIDAYGNDVINNGIINVNGIDSTGIRVQDLASTATNNGTINASGTEALGIYAGGNAKAINSGSINVIAEENGNGIGIKGSEIINDITGEIDISGSGFLYGMKIDNFNNQGSEKATNKGKITGTGHELYGIEGNNVINEGTIVLTSTDNAEGINDIENEWITQNVSILNNGNIEVEASTYAKGIGVYQGNRVDITNNGKILVDSTGEFFGEGVGIDAKGIGGTVINSSTGIIKVLSQNVAYGIKSSGINVINDGEITVQGNKGSAGIAVEGAQGTNNGIINIDGEGSFGMSATNGATVTNGVAGVINVGVSAAGGMYADLNSIAINDGTINIHKDNIEGNEIIFGGVGTLINNGTVTADANLAINSINGGAYVIGTSEDGSYGKISAKNVSIDGDVVVSAGITKNGFKNEYTMQNVVDAEDITLGDSFNFTSNSLLYDAEAVTDRWGNLDATLSRNNKILSDFTKGYITSTANIFEKYQEADKFEILSSDAKEVIKAIDTTSVESIDETLNGLTPTIYANLGRQILETSGTFKEQDMVAINSLGENSYNFTFIGEYQDVDSRNSIEGYKSKMSGFVGAMNFGDGTFGTIGYGYNDIDYKDNGKGHIQTIHLGLNRFGKYEGVDYNFGLGGEYNFHENKRDIDLLGRRAESDFDSYGVRASGEVSKVFGEKAYVKPYLGLDLAHMKYDSFTESKANSLNANVESENYTSVLPKVGFVVGDRFGGLNLFAGVEYSYELGNMDKEQNFSYEGFEGTAKLPKDSLECGTTGVKAGASYGVNNFTLGASIGKNFGRRDNSFASLSLGYSF